MTIAINILLLIVFTWIYFAKKGKQYPLVFWIGLVWKLFMGEALGLIYLYYYPASDTWLFFSDADVLVQLVKQDFTAYLKFLFLDDAPEGLLSHLYNSQERSLYLIKIMSLFSWMTGGNYWVSAMWFSLISFICAWYLFKIVSIQFENSWQAAALSFLLFPSVVFWSSGLIKETLALSGIYLVCGLYLKMLYKQKSNGMEYLVAALGFWIAWRLKYYWIAIFSSILLAHLVVNHLSKKILFINRFPILTWILVFALLGGLVSMLHPNFYPWRFLEVVVNNHDKFVAISNEKSLIHYSHLEANWVSIFLNAPWALFSGLFRPFIGESDGVLTFIASLENLIVFVLAISSLWNINKVGSHRLLLLSTIAYIIFLCIFLALSTPNLGTLSRYRVGFYPFLIFLVAYRNPILTYFYQRLTFLK